MTAQRLARTQLSVFDSDSEACHSALQELRIVLDHLGFTVRKKAAGEATLRVYPRRYGRYPLLNPRFESRAIGGRRRRGGGFLVFTVYSKGDERLDEHLREFPSEQGCEFVAAGTAVGIYYHHGDFVIPLEYTGPSGDEVNFKALGEPLLRMRRHLQMATRT